MTVSAGVACSTDHATHSAETIYRLADQALYQAKELCRNRVVIARFGRGRNAGRPAPPAQIPACATNAPGSCLR